MDILDISDEELTTKFVNFVKAQPADRLIHHSSLDVCAVGDFLRSEFTLSQQANILADDIVGRLPHAIWIVLQCTPLAKSIAPTYGDFAKWLQDKGF